MKKRVGDKELHKAIAEFEKQFGSIAFVKAILSVFNRILIDKGIVTKDQLLAYYAEELKSVRKKLTAMALERHKFFMHQKPTKRSREAAVVLAKKKFRVRA